MTRSFVLNLALREARSSARRLGLYMAGIALGVAALVALNSFRADVVGAVRSEGRALLGADLRLHSSAPFPRAVQAIIDAAAAAGVPVGYVTRVASMVSAPRTGRTRLVQLRAVAGGYPFYGEVETAPVGLWPLDARQRRALVVPAVLVQLGIRVGDSVSVGETRFQVAGTIGDLTDDVGLETAIGPPVYIPAAHLPATGLVAAGSLARWQAFLRTGDARSARAFVRRHERILNEHLVRFDTAEDEVEELTEAAGSLGRFLGLIGLTALLLGGVGVASAVHVFIRGRLPAAAVLRCLGATRRQVFAAYLAQTAALGLGGAAAGAVLGLVVQRFLPRLVEGFLPVRVEYAVHWGAVFGGLAVGAFVACLFALLPLLAVRRVAPLQALRQDFEPERSRDWARVAVYVALAASVLALSVLQAPTPRTGAGYALGIAAVLGLLWAAALLLVWATRRFFPARASYPLRQGVANLYRPRNQTVAVTLALGFGAFLIATIFLVQHSLLARFSLEGAEGRPNLLLFDIQPDQRAGVAAMARARGTLSGEPVPIVAARLGAINGRPAGEILRDTAGPSPEGWTLRREYRHTYRDSLTATETVVAGRWWEGDAVRRRPGSPPRISVEEDLARDLGVGVGDRITWDVQGRPIETEIASLRKVDWARFAPNFFVVFELGVLERAPQTLVALARVEDPTARAELQRDLVARFPNVSALDLALVQRTVDDVLGKVALAIRFLALFSAAAGLIVLIGALAASRFQRQREAALLRTLGASRRQIALVLLTEYAALGSLAALAGLGLAAIAGWALATFVFEVEASLPAGALLAAWAALALLTTAAGFASSRDVTRRPPLAVLREAGE